MELNNDSKSFQKEIDIIIVGAGKAGSLLAEDVNKSVDVPFRAVAFVDDDTTKVGKKVSNVEVLGTTNQIASAIKKTDAEEVWFAIPSARGSVIRKVVSDNLDKRITYRILPRASEVLAQPFKEDYLRFIRKVDPIDLVGGEINKDDLDDIKKAFKGKTIMITGAAGSIGSELSRQAALYGAKKVIYFDWWENGTFDLRNQLIESYPDGDFEFIIGDIKDKKRISSVIQKFRPHTIFHAAAYKHVPLMEDNPAEAIKNNILGTKTVGEAAIRYGVKKFVLVSSDKAVNPTNVMGATKRAAEKTIHILAESQDTTTFCAVRFGNVANSNGSVMPIFKRQIEKGGPITVTHKDITRYFMTIPEAVHLILKAWIMGDNNDLFVLDMGEPIKIYELAQWIIAVNGYIPNVDIKLEVTGLRPGEKLFEELLVDEESVSHTKVSNIFKTQNYLNFDRVKFLYNLTYLDESLENRDFESKDVKAHLQQMISTYKPAKH
jgi:FlaA1/EpsC-like NDP-sugar epimerase